MGSFKIVFFSLLSLLFVLYLVTITESTAISAADSHDETWLREMKTQFPRFSYLGEVEGKKFYVDFTLRNWDASVKFCEDFGMNIAKVQKRTEGGFLSNKLPPPPNIERHVFWVDGEDVRTSSQFKYKSGGAWNTEIATAFHRHSCIHFVRSQNGAYYLENNLCSTAFNVLCQI